MEILNRFFDRVNQRYPAATFADLAKIDTKSILIRTHAFATLAFATVLLTQAGRAFTAYKVVVLVITNATLSSLFFLFNFFAAARKADLLAMEDFQTPKFPRFAPSYGPTMATYERIGSDPKLFKKAIDLLKNEPPDPDVEDKYFHLIRFARSEKMVPPNIPSFTLYQLFSLTTPSLQENYPDRKIQLQKAASILASAQPKRMLDLRELTELIITTEGEEYKLFSSYIPRASEFSSADQDMVSQFTVAYQEKHPPFLRFLNRLGYTTPSLDLPENSA